MNPAPSSSASSPTPSRESLAAISCYASSCGRVTLYLGRWQDLLPLPVDAIITDQPYGTGWLRGGGKVGQFKPKKEGAEWDVQNLPRKQGDPLGCLQWTDFRTGRVRRWTVRIGDRRDRITVEAPGDAPSKSHGWTWFLTQLRKHLS